MIEYFINSYHDLILWGFAIGFGVGFLFRQLIYNWKEFVKVNGEKEE